MVLPPIKGLLKRSQNLQAIICNLSYLHGQKREHSFRPQLLTVALAYVCVCVYMYIYIQFLLYVLCLHPESLSNS